MPDTLYDATPAATSKMHGKAGGVVKLTQALLRLLLKIPGQISAVNASFYTPPEIRGVAVQGQVLSLYLKAQGLPTPTLAYQWKRDGTNIAGATSATYTLVLADSGTKTTCAVTATNAGGSTTLTTPEIGPVV